MYANIFFNVQKNSFSTFKNLNMLNLIRLKNVQSILKTYDYFSKNLVMLKLYNKQFEDQKKNSKYFLKNII
jgi:hypothetical protein